MKIGSLKAWETMESGEKITFPASDGATTRTVIVELMAIAAEVSITDGLGAYPIGVINGYDRLEFHVEDTPLSICVENGACSYKTLDLVEIGQMRLDGEEDASFTSPFERQDDGIDPAVKQLIMRSNARQRDREAYLMDYIEELNGKIRNRADDGPAPAGAGKTGADSAAKPGKGAEGEPPAAGVAGTDGASKPEGKPEGDAKPPVGEQPKT